MAIVPSIQTTIFRVQGVSEGVSPISSGCEWLGRPNRCCEILIALPTTGIINFLVESTINSLPNEVVAEEPTNKFTVTWVLPLFRASLIRREKNNFSLKKKGQTKVDLT
jgi:hypothetical protein